MRHKKFWGGAILAVVMMFSLIPSSFLSNAAEPTCDTYSGSNVNAQNYRTWAGTIKSYLTTTTDGFMRVQYGSSIGGVLAEYYDSEYNFKSSKIIEEELPIFGGFYETDSNYFLLTGQMNSEESDEVEVYRVTKYDKNWNRIASAGLYGANTYIPFDAGSARMDVCGDYLLIRTSHEMYLTSDGYHHQANVTIEVDMNNMVITDSYTGIMNTTYGYVSHSFNQFIHIEDNRIVAVDHGDAHPRSIALLKYQTDASTGSFVPTYSSGCKVINVMTFPGTTGTNTTGAAVGGFEISDSSYLIAGHSVVQDEDNLTRTTRNVFVASVDKATSEVNINWLTEYEEGDTTTTTPHMVEVGTDSYMVLWSRGSNVYYTLVNGNGEQAGDICTMEGASLSDCVPVVSGDKLVWYTWNNKIITFYEISLRNLSETNVTRIENGHVYEKISESDGTAVLECTRCGGQSEITLPTDRGNLWWTTGNYMTTAWPSDWEPGVSHKYSISFTPSDAAQECEVIISDPEILSWEKISETAGVITALKSGTTSVTVRSKWNPSVSVTGTVAVAGPLTLSSFAVGESSPQYVGTEINLSAEVTGGSEPYTYQFYFVDESGDTTVIQDYSDASTALWTPAQAVTGSLYVNVEDGEGTEVTSDPIPYVVERMTLAAEDFTFTAPSDLIYNGQAKEATVEVKSGAAGIGDITVTYYDSEGEQLDSAPVDAGAYTVKIDVAESNKYNATTALTDETWSFVITKAEYAPGMPEESITASHSAQTVKDVILEDGWSWEETSLELELPFDEIIAATAVYNGADKANYKTVSVVVSLLRSGVHEGGEATCTEKAVCSVCGMEYGELDPDNHTAELKDTKAATCTVDGTLTYICSVCGETWTEEIPATGHDWGEWTVVKEATTEEEGRKERICETCNEKESRLIDKLQPNTPVADIFVDVAEGVWYEEAVQYVYDKGLMEGNGDKFTPNGRMTRGMFVTTLYRLAGEPEVIDRRACTELNDVAENAWYTDAVCWAYANEITTGYLNDMTFRTNIALSREQLATFMYRYAEYQKLDTDVSDDLSGLLNADKVKEYAINGVKWAVGAGIISGMEITDGAGETVYDLAPQKTATRAQMARILMNFCEAYDI